MKIKKVLLNILYISLTVLVIAVIAFIDPEVKNIGQIFSGVDPKWFGMALFLMLLFYVGEGFQIHIISGFMGYRLNGMKSLNITAIGLLYSALTPFSSGGQPMQIIKMRRYGIPVGASTSILVLKFLLWQTAVTVFGLIGLILLWPYVIFGSTGTMLWALLGFVITSLIVLIFLFVTFKPHWIRKAGVSVLSFLHRCHIIKNNKKPVEVWNRTIDDYADAIELAKQNRKGMVFAVLAVLSSMAAYFGVTYFIYRAFGLTKETFIVIIMLQSIHYVVTAFMPLPGASGASEGGFYLFLGKAFTEQFTFVAMLAWRVVTYYLTIVLGMAVILCGNLLEAVKKRKKPSK